MVAGGVALLALSVSPSGAAPERPKSELPANINPNKSPADPSQARPDPAPLLTQQQQIQEARAFAAQDPKSRLVCYTSKGAVAGVAVMDRVDPGKAPTKAQAARVCDQGLPGSRP